MRLSTTTTILSRRRPVPKEDSALEAMRICREAGFTQLDMNFGTQGREGYPLAGDNWLPWIESVRNGAEKLGITFKQSHSFYFRTKESTDPAIDRPWYEERIRRSIVAAGILGVEWTVMHPADFYFDPVYDFEKNRRHNLAYWAPFIELAMANRVGFAFENMFPSGFKQRYCSHVDELIDLVDAFGDPRVGICWDTGHAALAGQNQGEAIRRIGKRMKATHINDNHARPAQDEHLIPYFGTNDWAVILQALRDIGYDNNFSFEIKAASQLLPPEACVDMMRFLFALGNKMMAALA